MKAVFRISALMMCLFCLSGCSRPQVPETSAATSLSVPAPVQETTVPVTLPEPTEPETTVPEITEPEHSELYLPGVPAVDVVLYFNEVCLNAEYINSGDPTALQKWTTPIYYHISGSPTQQDIDTLNRFALWLSYLEGFPGIYKTEDVLQANLKIYFCNQQELLLRMGENFRDADGAVTFWYQEDEIFNAVICCRTDLDQELRNSVILEELYNGLGPIQDTELRPDSLIYAGFSQPQVLTPMDELILKLLYHPAMECGMNEQQCAEVIRQLYY